MFAGHAALALLAKAARPRIPIAVLMPVAFAPDIIEYGFAVFGFHDRGLSHSLVSVGLGATVIGLIYLLTTRHAADATAVWLTYLSHWPADFITGLKPTWPGGPTVGLHFYERPAIDAVIECAIVAVCWVIYRRATARSQANAVSPYATTIFIPLMLVAAQIVFDFVQRGLVS